MKQAAPPFSEHVLQQQICTYMAASIRKELHWFAIPNGGKRDLRTAVKLKREGVKRGATDIVVLLEDGRVAWLELKIKGGSLSVEQQAFRSICIRLGHHWALIRSVDEAVEFLTDIGAVR